MKVAYATVVAEEPRPVWIQARDAAGNLSAPQVVSVASRAETLVDRAITLEEDAIEEASERVVKKRIRQSVVRLKLTESVVRHLAGAAAVRGRVRDLVDGAVSLKSRALVEVGRHNLVAARASLESALTLELELAVVLDQLGGPVECRDRGFEEDGEAE